MSDEHESLASALIAAAKEVDTLPKLHTHQKGFAYAKADHVVRAARILLAKHGLAWIRTGAKISGPILAPGRIGSSLDYVGQVTISGELVHATGTKEVSADMPIIAMAATPHDKATAASVTFCTGYLLLGVLNQDRADSEEINGREDPEEPLCVGKLGPLAESNKNRCEELAEIDGQTREAVWAWACQKCEIPLVGGRFPGPMQLYEGEGRRMSDLLQSVLDHKRQPPGGDDDQRQPGDGT